MDTDSRNLYISILYSNLEDYPWPQKTKEKIINWIRYLEKAPMEEIQVNLPLFEAFYLELSEMIDAALSLVSLSQIKLGTRQFVEFPDEVIDYLNLENPPIFPEQYQKYTPEFPSIKEKEIAQFMAEL